ncbi:MAG: diphosphomevalonate decarboxylase [Thermoanaerobaculia bacterium]
MSRGSRRATVSAPANIALVKYWGARDLKRALPYHPSISMTLEVCRTVTTVELAPALETDEIWFAAGAAAHPEPAPEAFARRVRAHLDRVWTRLQGVSCGRPAFRVATRNTFPAAAGLASSASGFAALAAAACRTLGVDAGARELSVLARLSGSGSAARSVFGGFVEWPAEGAPAAGAAPAEENPDAPAAQLAPAAAWRLSCVVAIVEDGPKEVSSREGHRLAPTSPHFARRLELVPERLETVRRAIRDRDLDLLGPVLERDAVELHAVAMTSEPPIFYWRPPTLEVLSEVRRLRGLGTGAWATMDAGANVHVLCTPEDEPRVAAALEAVPGVRDVLRDRVGDGPRDETLDLLAEADR